MIIVKTISPSSAFCSPIHLVKSTVHIYKINMYNAVCQWKKLTTTKTNLSNKVHWKKERENENCLSYYNNNKIIIMFILHRSFFSSTNQTHVNLPLRLLPTAFAAPTTTSTNRTRRLTTHLLLSLSLLAYTFVQPTLMDYIHLRRLSLHFFQKKNLFLNLFLVV